MRRHLQILITVLILYSCSHKESIIERGELSPGLYENKSLGMKITFEENLTTLFYGDSLNRITPIKEITRKWMDLNTEELLIGFHNESNDAEIMVLLYPSNKTTMDEVKNYVISANRERVEKRGVELNVKNSPDETLKINGVDYLMFTVAYELVGRGFYQTSQYACTIINDLILVIELPKTSDSEIINIDRDALVKFIQSIDLSQKGIAH